MLRLPAVAGRFYPSNPKELTALVREYSRPDPHYPATPVKACLTPHAGYMYSGHVAGAGLARVELPQKLIILGVRHYPRGEEVAILSSGAWRTPLGDAPIDEALAEALRRGKRARCCARTASRTAGNIRSKFRCRFCRCSRPASRSCQLHSERCVSNHS